MGTRYGGLKQVDPVGPSGESLLDYSVFDASRAGFERVVFVIRRDIEADFRASIGSRFEAQIDVDYAFQSLDDLPRPFARPVGRVKPWGTGHATLAARDIVTGPCAVINADDFYGRDAYVQLASFLRAAASAQDPRAALVAYQLDRTLSEYGSVSRGICEVNDSRDLASVRELTKIVRNADTGRIEAQVSAGSVRVLAPETPVSMNTWGFRPGVMDLLASRFRSFCAARLDEPGSEFFLPGAIDELIAARELSARVLLTRASWFGLTYREDRPRVSAAIARLIEEGEYPVSLAQSRKLA